MSLQDGIFVEEVENDITLFSKDARRKRVLVFPPVNSYRRFIIHQLVQDRFADLFKTFSIGQGIARRTVVCYQSDVLSHPKLNGVPSGTCVELTDSFPLDTACGAMGVEESRRSPEDSTSPEHSRMRQVKTSPAVEIYRPPAARRASRDGQSSSTVPIVSDSSSSSAKVNRQRRPDRAVYVPKHRRSTEADEVSQVPEETIPPQCRSRCNRARTNSPLTTLENEEDSFRKQFSPHDHDRNERISSGSCDKRVSAMRSTFSTETCSKNDERRETIEDRVEPPVEIQRGNKLTRDYSSARENSDKKSFHEENEGDSEEILSRCLSTSTNDIVKSTVMKKHRNEQSAGEPLASNDARRNSDFEIIRESSTTSCCTTKGDEIRESLDRNNEQTNNKNLRNPSSRDVSNVLIISEAKERGKEDAIPSVDKENAAVTAVSPPEKKPKKVARVKSKPASPPSPTVKLNRDECDWDSLFDDNGDCLDPTLIEELTAAVGEVTIEQPKNDYKAFTRPVEISSDEFGHVVEIYNFPSDFKTSDLAAVFSPWKNGGFELKWVDDTHCLGVFSSPLVAAEVLGSDHPFVKTRPLSAATSLSKTKARKSVEFLQPYKSRPQTCAALARRLVTGALGVKLATARQEREQEKLLLREAKEKRRLANKQREDVWEGIITEK